jgi:hypothetical protein
VRVHVCTCKGSLNKQNGILTKEIIVFRSPSPNPRISGFKYISMCNLVLFATYVFPTLCNIRQSFLSKTLTYDFFFFGIFLLNAKVGWMFVKNNNVLMMVKIVGYFM